MIREGRDREAIASLFGEDCVKQEPARSPMPTARVQGRQAMLDAYDRWVDRHDLHAQSVDGPYPHGDRFAVVYDLDFTARQGPMAGRRVTMREIGLFRVEKGWIERCEFMYPTGDA